MKPSNYRTPRTLSDGSFSVGYPVAYRRSSSYPKAWWIAVCAIAIVSAVLIVRTA